MSEKSVIWVSGYFPEWDALIAVPVRGDGPALQAIEKKQATLVTKVEATQMNKALSDSDPHLKKYIEERLAYRWCDLRSRGYGE